MDETLASPASRGIKPRLKAFVREGFTDKFVIPTIDVKPEVGDCRAVESAEIVESRRGTSKISHGLLSLLATFWSDNKRIGRKLPSKVTLISVNDMGAEFNCAREVIVSWDCKGSPTFPSGFPKTNDAETTRSISLNRRGSLLGCKLTA
jgi:hypothetical protein